MTITYALPINFLGISNSSHTAEYCVLGIPYDFGTTNRPGARFGPEAIRSASRMLTDGDHPVHRFDPKTLDLADIGNLGFTPGNIAESHKLVQEQLAEINHPISLGGDHSISLPILRALYDRIGTTALIHFDAHMDTWPDDAGGKHCLHGNPFYHAINEGLVDPHHMVQIGIRSPIEQDVYDWTISKGVTVLTGREPDVVARIKGVVGLCPVYLTFDIDCLDPAFAPGTGTPEIGGLPTYLVQQILRGLSGLNFVGMDMVEVSPPYDVSDITALAAATLVWEYLCLLR